MGGPVLTLIAIPVFRHAKYNNTNHTCISNAEFHSIVFSKMSELPSSSFWAQLVRPRTNGATMTHNIMDRRRECGIATVSTIWAIAVPKK